MGTRPVRAHPDSYPPTPAQIEGLTDVVALAEGPGCSDWGRRGLAETGDGTVWAWEMSPSPSPAVQVSGLTGVVRVAAGGCHGLALKRDGTVWAWGSNYRGQVGDGTTRDRPAPVQVALLTGVVAIAARGANSLAMKSDGTVWVWGDNQFGQLGDGRALIQVTPVQVIQPGSPDLTLAMSHSGDFATGGQGVYELTVSNVGVTATAGMVTVIDSLPLGLTYVSAAGMGGTCSAADQVVSCTNPGPINPGASMSITLTVSVGPSSWPGVTNLAIVSNESDRNVANNAAGDPVVVLDRRN